MKKKVSWFDWVVTGAFWLMGITMAIGMVVIAFKKN